MELDNEIRPEFWLVTLCTVKIYFWNSKMASIAPISWFSRYVTSINRHEFLKTLLVSRFLEQIPLHLKSLLQLHHCQCLYEMAHCHFLMWFLLRFWQQNFSLHFLFFRSLLGTAFPIPICVSTLTFCSGDNHYPSYFVFGFTALFQTKMLYTFFYWWGP